MTTNTASASRATPLLGWFLELEITGRCQLACRHCYAESGPTVGHGTMSADDWCALLTEAASLGATRVQLIGGEPTAHPEFERLLGHAIRVGLAVEVFSNLLRVREHWWELFAHPRVSLACSYYSDTAAEHDRVTGRAGSHARTRSNITEAVRRGIPIRAGIIDLGDGPQRVEHAAAELRALGVANVSVDRMRGVGRGGQALGQRPSLSELCGRCGRDRAAISSYGDVWPCVLGRFLPAGNVHLQGLAEILAGPVWCGIIAAIPEPRASECDPDCKPASNGGDCAPAEREACGPSFCNPDSE